MHVYLSTTISDISVHNITFVVSIIYSSLLFFTHYLAFKLTNYYLKFYLPPNKFSNLNSLYFFVEIIEL